jgi:hypothetical protein
MYTTKHPLATYLGLPLYRDLPLEEIDRYINPGPDTILENVVTSEIPTREK